MLHLPHAQLVMPKTLLTSYDHHLNFSARNNIELPKPEAHRSPDDLYPAIIPRIQHAVTVDASRGSDPEYWALRR